MIDLFLAIGPIQIFLFGCFFPLVIFFLGFYMGKKIGARKTLSKKEKEI